MNGGWQKFYEDLLKAGMLEEFISLMQGEAMTRSRQACQVGQSDEVRRDALADIRFCLCRADEAAKALVAAKEKASSDAAAGFQKGGAPLA